MQRKPFQGVYNIIKFNWHFYAGSAVLFMLVMLFLPKLPNSLQFIGYVGISLALFQIVISLLVSWYVYDYSNLYQLNWLAITPKSKVLNLNAGFDETSALLKEKFPKIQLTVGDFYNPKQHTEVSIRRARAAYPPVEGTISIQTTDLPFADDSFDFVFAILSVHEIRNTQERQAFFGELKRVLKPSGTVYITEHLRDLPNFIVYSIGCFHFHSLSVWLNAFEDSGFQLKEQLKLNPFISSFKLQSHGNTP